MARTSVTGTQSNFQMMYAIQQAGPENTAYFEEYRDTLASVSVDDFTDALSTCKGHELVTVIGPIDDIEDKFTEYGIESGIEYETPDWEELHTSYPSEKEQKKYLKDKTKAEANKGAKSGETEADAG